MLFMRKDRERPRHFSIPGLIIFIFGFSVYSSCVLAQNRDGTHFVIEAEVNKETAPSLVAGAIRVLESRLKGLGVKSEITKSRNKRGRIEVKIFGNHDIEILRGLFTNHRLELKAVVSPPSPNPYKAFPTFADAVIKIVGDQEVRPYMPDDEDEHFVILERTAIVDGKDIRKAETFSRTGFDDDYQIEFSLNSDGAAAISEWTGKNINNYLSQYYSMSG